MKRLRYPLDPQILDAYLRLALREDGADQDATSRALIPPVARARAEIRAKSAGVLCGVDIARRIFRMLDPDARARSPLKDGAALKPGDLVLRIEGRTRALLAAERTALNFLQRLSGVATLTRRFAEALAGTGAHVYDTRKTTPLWRALERHAVRVGGGHNHRFALDDMIMIKDNHSDAAGGVGRAIALARRRRPELTLAAEARTLEEAREAAEAGADIVMLDNMTPARFRRAVAAMGGKAQVEATGGITLKNIRAYALAGADRLSVGALTHSAPAMDFSMSLTPRA